MKEIKSIPVLFLFLIIFLGTNVTAINSSLSIDDNWNYTEMVICNASGAEWNKQICKDGAGGAFIVWQDSRNGNWDIFIQRISSNGVPLWEKNGLLICNTSKEQVHPKICSDGKGGVFITWYDFISGPDYGPINIQRVSFNGEIMWKNNGIAISDESINTIEPIISRDGEGGIFVIWRQGGSGIYNLYTQRINSTGDAIWNEYGIMITNNTVGYTADQCIIYDNNKGAITVWEDDRTGESKIYAQRIDSSGNPLWDDNGLIICNAKKRQLNPQICSDGEDGVIITWIDNRDNLVDVYAQSVDSDGNILWGENGTIICNTTNRQVFPQIVSDRAGGAVIFWEDNRTGTNWDIYTQKISATGTIQWQYNGTLICNANNAGDLYSQVYFKACSNDLGGAFIAWRDYRNGTNWDIYAQSINGKGIEQWEDNGKAICTANNDQGSVVLCSDGIGNVFIAWGDKRDHSLGDIYAVKIYMVPGQNLINSFNVLIIICLSFSIIIVFWKKRKKLFTFFNCG